MKQVILLAGLHKTATTSIQQTCVANLPLLKSAGFDYPSAQHDGKWESNHSRLVNALFGREPHKHGLQAQFTMDAAPVPGSQARLREKFAATIASSQKLLVVAENVSLFDVDELELMKDWFQQQGMQVRMMCHVRHLSGWFNSMVAQRVTGLMRMTIEAAVEEFRAHGSIVRDRVEALRQVFPDTGFYSHERAVQHPEGPVGFYFQNIGLQPPAQLRFVRANEGRSDCATRVLSIINERFGQFNADGSSNPSYHAGPAVQRLLDEVGGGKFTLRRAEVLPVLGMLDADNQWLRDNLGEDFFDTRMEFKEGPWRWKPETTKPLGPALGAMPAPIRNWVASNLPRIGIQPTLR